jgi:molecular chaperone GrpE
VLSPIFIDEFDFYAYLFSMEHAEDADRDVKEPELPLQQAEMTADEQLVELQKNLADTKDQLLRKAADFDNYRKRMIREKQEAIDYANATLLGDLIDSLDNLDRALDAAKTATDTTAVVNGVSMVQSQLVSMLENKYNLASYGVAGDAFDPNDHEAIASVPGEVSEPTCGDVFLKGYKLKDRVIRHAKVQVIMPAANTKNNSEGDKNE